MKKFITAVLSLSLMLSISSVALATGNTSNTSNTGNTVNPWGNDSDGADLRDVVKSESGLGNADPRAMAASLINVMLGFLGIIAVVIILLGGFKWMTAAGNEDKISESKKLLAAGVIGLIIILMSYGLAQLVLDQLLDATGATVL